MNDLPSPREDSSERVLYYCMSRSLDGAILFDEAGREMFLRLLSECAQMSQVRVPTCYLKPDEFHLLVEVPVSAKAWMEERSLIETVAMGFGEQQAQQLELDLQRLRANGDETLAQKIIQGWLSRIWDMGAFMKALKQRFSQWYNLHHRRYGVLWESRYKFAVVAPDQTLMMDAEGIRLVPERYEGRCALKLNRGRQRRRSFASQGPSAI